MTEAEIEELKVITQHLLTFIREIENDGTDLFYYMSGYGEYYDVDFDDIMDRGVELSNKDL